MNGVVTEPKTQPQSDTSFSIRPADLFRNSRSPSLPRPSVSFDYLDLVASDAFAFLIRGLILLPKSSNAGLGAFLFGEGLTLELRRDPAMARVCWQEDNGESLH